MRIACLGSGSRGNAFVAELRGVTFLVDCGFSARALRSRLALRNVSAGEIDHILLTHEHADHSRGLGSAALESGASVWMTEGTARRLGYEGKYFRLRSGEAAVMDGVEVMPFGVCHDAEEPVQFILDDGSRRLGIVTDLGRLCAGSLSACSDLDGLVVECNYDWEMLRENRRYPPRVKERIAGGMGHLENNEAVELARAAGSGGKLRFLAAAHLSENNNRPELARAALARGMGRGVREIAVADQQSGFSWRTV